MKVINILGEPSAGKSCTAGGLFYYMKREGYNVELISEYAKKVVWEGHFELLNDQLYLLAKQNRSLERLRGKVDYVITDSPLLLVKVYAEDRYDDLFKSFVDSVWNSYDNINFLLTRNHKYDPVGRMQTEDEALAVRMQIMDLLDNSDAKYTVISGDDPAQSILDHIKLMEPK